MHNLINRLCHPTLQRPPATPPARRQTGLVAAPLASGAATVAAQLAAQTVAQTAAPVATQMSTQMSTQMAPLGKPAVAGAAAAQPAGAGVCGWFDSSLDLRCGLAVSEVCEPDWTVLALWFGPAALRAASRLQ